jgi:hypothetical protein
MKAKKIVRDIKVLEGPKMTQESRKVMCCEEKKRQAAILVIDI